MNIKDFSKIYEQGFDATWNFVSQLEEKVLELNAKIRTDSTNSSKAPSSDMAKKKRNNSRKPSDKKRGGQPGHTGSTILFCEDPDDTEIHVIKSCQCGHLFNGSETIIKEEKRQVIDIPEPKIQVTEHKVITYLCPICSKVHSAEFPEGVNAPVQYGNNLKTYVVYLMNYQLLPYKRTADLFANLHNLPISEGTLAKINSEFAGRLDIPLSFIKQTIIASEVVHFDESGLYAEGKRNWLHVASTNQYTFYFSHMSRGKNALDEAGILPHFHGTACHDSWKTYYRFNDCKHSLCNAHHLRELQGIIDNYSYNWAIEMKVLLENAKKLVDDAIEKDFSSLRTESIVDIEKCYGQIIINGYKEVPKPLPKPPKQRGRQKKGKALCLLTRLDERKSEILDFIHDFSKPFDNNQAERDIRMMKVKQKISGTFRSNKGAEYFCKSRSYISTAIKHGNNIFDTIKRIYTGNTPPPYHFAFEKDKAS